MESFRWLNDLLQWVGRWFPRLVLVRIGYHCVRFGPGGGVRVLTPGLHVYWPIIHEIQSVSMQLRSLEIAGQMHGSECISVVVFYAVRDADKVVRTIQDVTSFLDDQIQAALTHAWSDVAPDGAIETQMATDLHHLFQPLGIHIASVSIVQRARPFALKTFADYATHAPRGL